MGGPDHPAAGGGTGDAQYGFDRAVHMMDGAPVDFLHPVRAHRRKKFGNMDLYCEKGDEAYYDSVIDSYLDSVLELWWSSVQVLGHLTLPLRYISEHHESI